MDIRFEHVIVATPGLVTGLNSLPMPRFHPGADRERLQFRNAVLRAFAFLDRKLGFEVVQAESTFVRFESQDVFVNVFHGRGSFELGVEIGLRQGPIQTAFTLADIITLDHDLAQIGRVDFQVNTRDGVQRLVDRLGLLTQEYAAPALQGDREYFARLAQHASAEARRVTDSYRAGPLRERGDSAWHRKDYARVTAAYEELGTFTELTRSEAGRLKYARKQLRADDHAS